MRKINDHYSKMAKKDNYPARSVYKLAEIQKKYKILKQKQRVLDLGCHPGSWSLYAAKIVKNNGVVVGVDLQETDIPSQKDDAEINWLCYNVNSEELIPYLKKQWNGFHVVLSDMAPRTTGNQFSDHQHSLRLAYRVLEIACSLLHKNGTLYVKVFQGEDFPAYVKECRKLFQNVKVFKPDSSRKESREVFLIGREFKGPGKK